MPVNVPCPISRYSDTTLTMPSAPMRMKAFGSNDTPAVAGVTDLASAISPLKPTASVSAAMLPRNLRREADAMPSADSGVPADCRERVDWLMP